MMSQNGALSEKETWTWLVENFQIPVPLGDCSVHVLINKGKVTSAFLMDGGENADTISASDTITKSLEVIDKELGLFLDNKPLKLNAWVVTHWDADHYKGVFELLEGRFSNNKLMKGNSSSFLNRLDTAHTDLYFGHERTIDQKKIIEKHFDLKRCLVGKDIIGLDLFSGDRLFDAEGDNLKLSPFDEARPRFCVYAASGVGMNCTQGIFRQGNKEPDKNESSILAILSWPETGRCSYFAGGDGNAELAAGGILSFIRDQCDIAKLPEGHGFDVMKMDHHGSSAETFFKKGVIARLSLEKLPITQFRPRNIIVTPGSRHGHPSK
ncbi:hypothetical protein FNYG_11624 [Fusarium nygamai]|uniref:Metallo-beta-lactamase domain-containing protein n=1 Tax=Gibberella nygamai TaxID=42673 RepID=A0A2K0VY65_GIBNY|nr:hypothetical protein FNYG_11624 [Fusarium nygamai]